MRVGVCRCVVEGGTWVGVGGCGCWVVVVLKTATRGLTRPTAAWFQHPVSMATASQFSMATASQVSMATAPSPWQQPRLHGNSPVSMATAPSPWQQPVSMATASQFLRSFTVSPCSGCHRPCMSTGLSGIDVRVPERMRIASGRSQNMFETQSIASFAMSHKQSS